MRPPSPHDPRDAREEYGRPAESAFELAGVNIGDRLIGRNHSNRRGHFEDIEFEEFHEQALGRTDKNHLTVTRAEFLEMTSEDVARAQRVSGSPCAS